MSAATVTMRGRVAAERDMLDSCVITRLSGSVADPDTGVLTPTYSTVYTGKCKLQQSSPATAPTTVGEAEVFLGPLVLHLPMSDPTSGNVAPDDLVTMTVCLLDASLVGKTAKLRGPAHKSYATARRFPLVEVSG